jgi:hypothetical protein
MIYRIAVRDGKSRERNGGMAAFLVTDGNIMDMNMEDIWEFQPTNSSLLSTSNYNTQVITKSKDIADAYADRSANNLVTETLPRLVEVAGNTKEAIIRYYSKEIEKVQTKISQYEQRIDESPSFSRLAEREKQKNKATKK